MKIVLIGAGSAQFGLGMLGDIFQSKILKGAEVCLMDINPDTLERVARTGREYIETKGLSFSLTHTTSRQDAIRGADHVIISIEAGDRFELWDMDWNVPKQFGISQVYGENGGAGGLFHALRILPPILEICEDVVNLAPEAWVFCYSNPMTSITTAVLRKYPGLKFTGMCHEIASLSRSLPVILDTDIDNISFRAAGLNHFSVMLDVSYRDSGRDAYEEVMEKAPAYFEKEAGYSEILSYYLKTGEILETEGARKRIVLDNDMKIRPWSDRRLFRYIMENFNLLPITVDSHLGEYIPWAHEVADHKGILDFYTYYRHALAASDTTDIKDEAHERVVFIMEGIKTDSGYEEVAVNVMNEGFIPTLPRDIAVEVPARISRKGIEGISFPDYPRGFGALLRNYCGVYDLTAQAVLDGSRDAAVQALLVNPVINRCGSIPSLVDHMIDRQNRWLGYLK